MFDKGINEFLMGVKWRVNFLNFHVDF